MIQLQNWLVHGKGPLSWLTKHICDEIAVIPIVKYIIRISINHILNRSAG